VHYFRHAKSKATTAKPLMTCLKSTTRSKNMGIKSRLAQLESKQTQETHWNPGCFIIGFGSEPIGFTTMGTWVDVMREPGESLQDLERRCIVAAKERGDALMFIEISKQRIPGRNLKY
jgi:hypothetical protein